jgi:epoxyqueuosine reductase
MDLTQQAISLCKEHGFNLVGVTSAHKSKWSTEFEQWLQAGKHGEMGWLAKNVSMRLNPTELVDGAVAVLCVADRYASGEDESQQFGFGKVARYARGLDYHNVMKKRLHSVCDALRERSDHPYIYRSCVDTAPLLERECAAAAGIGAIGKNTLLIDQSIGSWLMLGAIVTTAPLSSTHDGGGIDPCGTCTRCIDACPTKAISPWSVDARSCISYLTIEHRGTIEERWHQAIGDWIFGCEICQEVCPHNQQTEKTRHAQTHPAYEERFHSLALLDVLNWTEENRRKELQGSAMKRAKLDMLRRNAVIVAKNQLAQQENPELRSAVLRIAQDQEEPMLVREAAKGLV